MSVILDDAVDGEMGVNRAHFIRETLGDASDHVCDKALDSSQTCNVFASTLPDSEGDLVGRLALD